MTEQSLQDMAARLFETARQEAPRPGAAERAAEVVVASRRGRGSAFPFVRRWRAPLVAAAALALATGVWLLVRPLEAPLQIRPETWFGRATSEVEPKKAPASASSPAELDASARPLPPRPKSPGEQRSRARSKPAPSLNDELAALGAARDALAAGNAVKAMKALDYYDATLRGKKLRAEARVLRMEALATSGQRKAASRLAERFIAAEPTHPLADRARSFLMRAASTDAAAP